MSLKFRDLLPCYYLYTLVKQGFAQMALDLAKLNASVDALAAAVAAIPAPVDDSADQAAVDAVASRVDSITASVPKPAAPVEPAV